MAKVLAIDLGTTLVKCTLFDTDGQMLAVESIRCCLEYPGPDMVEQDVSVWYEEVCTAIRKLLVGHDPSDVLGLSVSSQGISVVPVDEGFSPLSKAISWLDKRGKDECFPYFSALSRERWLARTGKDPSKGWTLGKILWLRKNRPDLYQKTSKFLMPVDFLNAKMTGCAVTDYTLAAGTTLYDLEKEDWSDEVLEIVGLSRNQLAEIRPSGAYVGEINEETIKRTGLKPGTKVFNGGQDQKVAAFAVGISQHRTSLSLGTAAAIEVFVQNPFCQNKLPVFPYITPGQLVVEGCVGTAGATVQWMKDTICGDLDFEMVNQLAAESEIGAGGIWFVPTFNQKADIPMESYGSVRNITLATTRGDLIRAMYEGLAYEIRRIMDAAKEAGSETRELVAFGGISKSDVFCQIVSDVLDLNIQVTENSEMCSIGAAKFVVAGMGMDSDAFAASALGNVRLFIPNEEAVKRYEDLYRTYILTR